MNKKPARARPPMKHTDRRFVAEYLKDLNATQAYQRVFGPRKNANRLGPELLSKPVVAAAVAVATAVQLNKVELSAARVLEELRRMAFVDATDILNCRTVEELRALPAEVRAAILGFEVVEANVSKLRDGQTETVRRVKVADKARALELLAKHFKLLTDVVESQDLAALYARLDRGRARNAAGEDEDGA